MSVRRIGSANITAAAVRKFKMDYKVDKWARRMNKEFASVKISATKEQQELGKKYMLTMI